MPFGVGPGGECELEDAPAVVVAVREVAVHEVGELASHAETDPDRFGLGGGLVEPVVRLKDRFPFVFEDAGSVDEDSNDDGVTGAFGVHSELGSSVAKGVGNEVA